MKKIFAKVRHPPIAPVYGYLRMQILLIGATGREISPSIQFITERQSAAHEIRFDTSGVGSPATIYNLARLISLFRPAMVIQAGIAGAFADGSIGNTYVINEDCFADLGVEEKTGFQTVFDMGLSDPDAFPHSKGLLQNPWKKLMDHSNLKPVNAVTVNEITTRPERIQWFKQSMDPFVETMEGAALHYVCLRESIPFIQFRTVSNKVGERDKSKWKITDAIENLNKELISFINKLETCDENYFRI